MKKLSLFFSVLLLLSACTEKEKKDEVKEKQPVNQETVKREADHSKTKFVLFQSDYGPKETYQKMKGYLEEKGMFYPRTCRSPNSSKKCSNGTQSGVFDDFW